MSPGAPETPIEPLVELTAPKSALAPGDRVPNFVLADQEGAFRAFYDRARGNPLALLILTEGAAAA
jgi:hypothetical protein